MGTLQETAANSSATAACSTSLIQYICGVSSLVSSAHANTTLAKLSMSSGCQVSQSQSYIIYNTTSESVEATLRIRRLLLAGCMARMGEERLPKKAMLGEMIGGKSYLGGQE